MPQVITFFFIHPVAVAFILLILIVIAIFILIVVINYSYLRLTINNYILELHNKIKYILILWYILNLINLLLILSTMSLELILHNFLINYDNFSDFNELTISVDNTYFISCPMDLANILNPAEYPDISHNEAYSMKNSISEKLKFQLRHASSNERSHIYNKGRYGSNAITLQEHYILRDKLLSVSGETYTEKFSKIYNSPTSTTPIRASQTLLEHFEN